MIKLEKMRCGYAICVEDENFLIVPQEDVSYEEIKNYAASACGYASITNQVAGSIWDTTNFYHTFDNQHDAFRYFMKIKYNCEVIKIEN